MKLKYLFLSVLAASSLLFSCTPEELVSSLSEFKVEQSYIGFTAAGGSITTAVEATDSWSIDASSVPDWIKVSPTSGSAGPANITFMVGKNDTGSARKKEVKVNVGDKVQLLTVNQAAEEVGPQPVTPIAKVIETGEGTFRIKGTVTIIANTQYGNFYVEDETGSIYIYGVLNSKGQYPKDAEGGWDSFGIEAGDKVTLEGPYKLYGTTPELVDAAIISIEKSLIAVEPGSVELEPEAGTFQLKVAAKVNGVTPVVDATWLRFQDIAIAQDSLVYTFGYDANTRTATRTTTITFKAPGAMKSVSVSQLGVPPTGATITEIVAMDDNSVIETLECTTVAKTTKGIVVSDGTTALYVYGGQVEGVNVGDNLKLWATKTTYNGVPELTTITGVDVISTGNPVKHPTAKDITSSAGEYTAEVAEFVKLSGTLSISGNYYNITLDGLDPETKMGSIVYPTDDIGAKAFDGKKITVTGYFNGLSSKGRYINVIATKVAEFVDNPKGTVKNPYGATEIATLIKGGEIPEGKVYVKGIINKIDNVNTQYGNAQYWLSTDGTTADFEVYRGFYYGGEKFTEETKEAIKEGDVVVVVGEVTLYNDIAEFKANNYLYTINGKALPVGEGTADSPYNVTKAMSIVEAGAQTDEEVYVKGVIAKIDNVNLQYGNAQYWISDDGGTLYMMEVYRGLYLNGEKFTAEDQIAVGDLVTVCGKIKQYKETIEVDANNKLIAIE